MPKPTWSVTPCRNCGADIRMIKTRFGWRPFERRKFKPHKCGKIRPKLVYVPFETDRSKH